MPHAAAQRSTTAALRSRSSPTARAPLPSRSGPPLPLPFRAAVAELLRPAVAELHAPGPARRGRRERREQGLRPALLAAAGASGGWPARGAVGAGVDGLVVRAPGAPPHRCAPGGRRRPGCVRRILSSLLLFASGRFNKTSP